MFCLGLEAPARSHFGQWTRVLRALGSFCTPRCMIAFAGGRRTRKDIVCFRCGDASQLPPLGCGYRADDSKLSRGVRV